MRQAVAFRTSDFRGMEYSRSEIDSLQNRHAPRYGEEPTIKALREHLLNRGIPTEIYYPRPLHLQKAFAYLGHKPGDFPESEAAGLEVLSLPIYPELTDEQQRLVVAAIADFDAE